MARKYAEKRVTGEDKDLKDSDDRNRNRIEPLFIKVKSFKAPRRSIFSLLDCVHREMNLDFSKPNPC
jgi:hypothetical protein